MKRKNVFGLGIFASVLLPAVVAMAALPATFDVCFVNPPQSYGNNPTTTVNAFNLVSPGADCDSANPIGYGSVEVRTYSNFEYPSEDVEFTFYAHGAIKTGTIYVHSAGLSNPSGLGTNGVCQVGFIESVVGGKGIYNAAAGELTIVDKGEFGCEFVPTN